MKTIKLLLLSLIIIIGLQSFSQTAEVIKDTKETVQTIDNIVEKVTESDVELLVDKYSAKIEASLISLAKTLQQPAERIYSVLVKKSYIDGILAIGFFIFGLILITGHLNKWADVWLVITILGAVLFIGGSIAICDEGLNNFINPDYGAIKDITDLFK